MDVESLGIRDTKRTELEQIGLEASSRLKCSPKGFVAIVYVDNFEDASFLLSEDMCRKARYSPVGKGMEEQRDGTYMISVIYGGNQNA